MNFNHIHSFLIRARELTLICEYKQSIAFYESALSTLQNIDSTPSIQQIKKIISEEYELVRRLSDESAHFDTPSTSSFVGRKKSIQDDELDSDDNEEENFIVNRRKPAPFAPRNDRPEKIEKNESVAPRKPSLWKGAQKPKSTPTVPDNKKKAVPPKKSGPGQDKASNPSAPSKKEPESGGEKVEDEESDYVFEDGETILDLLPDPGNELCVAAWEGKTEDVKNTLFQLTSKSPTTSFLTEGEEKYALHCACAGGHAEIVKTLITSGASTEILLKDKKPISFSKSKIIKMVIKTFTLLNKELDSVIGLSEVKQNLYQLANKIILDKKREEAGFKTSRQGRDMVLEGNPGVGKTSIARLISRLYYELGVTKRKSIVEVQRSDLVGSYVGQTGPKTRQIIESAKGGVLFVDEAYRLSQVQGKDFGQEAIDELMQFMNGSDADVVFIFAGYKKEMEQFIASNPGLFRRISYRLNFQDYSPSEIAQILLFQVPQKKYKLHPDVTLEWVSGLIENNTTVDLRSMMNGGLAAKVVDTAIEYQNEELSLDETGETLLILQKQHFERAIKKYSGNPIGSSNQENDS